MKVFMVDWLICLFLAVGLLGLMFYFCCWFLGWFIDGELIVLCGFVDF